MPPLFALPFPAIDPIAISVGPIAVRWYALAYVAGLLLAVWYMKRLAANARLWAAHPSPVSATDMDDLLIWITLGVVLGGRIGYVVFYNSAWYLAHPLDAFKLWHGGMSFHGGFLGVVVACWLFGARRSIGLDTLLDLGAASVPIGLGLGRIANFINGELYGRITDVPWAVLFPVPPDGHLEARHPSQLYEAALEGLVLFLLVRIATHRYLALSRPGEAAGIFALGYGTSRILVEFFREPDSQIGTILGGWVTMGMLLSLPLIAVGFWLIARARLRSAPP